jgi:alpha-N-arabinofuranosidase
MLTYGRGTSIQPAIQSPTFNVDGYKLTEFNQVAPYENVPYIEASCAHNADKNEVAIFLINRNWEEDMEVEIDARGFEGYKLVEHSELYNDGKVVNNSYENQTAFVPKANPATRMENGKVVLNAKKLSWNGIRLAK